MENNRTYSLNLERLTNYKPDIDWNTRIVFEILFYRYLYNKMQPIEILEDGISLQFGIEPWRTASVIDWLIRQGYLERITQIITDVETTTINVVISFGTDYFEVMAKEMMLDPTSFLKDIESFIK